MARRRKKAPAIKGAAFKRFQGARKKRRLLIARAAKLERQAKKLYRAALREESVARAIYIRSLMTKKRRRR